MWKRGISFCLLLVFASVHLQALSWGEVLTELEGLPSDETLQISVSQLRQWAEDSLNNEKLLMELQSESSEWKEELQTVSKELETLLNLSQTQSEQLKVIKNQALVLNIVSAVLGGIVVVQTFTTN